MTDEKVEAKTSNRLTWYRDGVGLNGWSMRLSNVPTNLKKTGTAVASFAASNLFGFFNTAQAAPAETVTFQAGQTHYKCDFYKYRSSEHNSAYLPEQLERIKDELINNQLCNATAITPPEISYDLVKEWVDTLFNQPAVDFWRAVGEMPNINLEQCINTTIEQAMQSVRETENPWTVNENAKILGSIFGTMAFCVLVGCICCNYEKIASNCGKSEANNFSPAVRL